MDDLSRQTKGRQAELLAYEFLQKQGLRLIHQNYYCRYGEIDLIMQDRKEIVFVEVRSRSRIDFGNASDSLNRKKVIKVIKAAIHYLQQKNCLHSVSSRFDVIAIHPISGEIQLEWIKNAFSSDAFLY